MAGSVQNGGSTNIVNITDKIARASTVTTPLGFPPSFLNAGPTAIDRIETDDVLTVIVWENVLNGLLAPAGGKSTTLARIRVNEQGNIFIPYAGVIRARGRTTEELRQKITALLSSQTPDPQVEVKRKAGKASTVNLVGGVNKQGVFLLNSASSTLTSVLASAGGVALDPAGTKITVQRGGQSGSIWLRDLYANPANDINLRAHDRIVVAKDSRFFTVLGSTSGQTRVDFKSTAPNIIDALAAVNGLNGSSANPRGIFIFRMEAPEIANTVLNTSRFTAPQRVAYVLDLTKKESIFTAQAFKIRDHDTIYVTEAPYVAWSRVLDSIAGSLTTVSNIAVISKALKP